ncbi:MAG: hypothetical protein C0613_15075 [Desulfobulbaceae bacterium]|nr:MAG: hypothetical protein C0613_15075 [Desulfobulbaceae bacterium]
MQVTNYTYAQTFGGFVPDTPITSILDAFNTELKEGHTEHNLKDIYTYAKDHFSYFSDYSNPCLACHNPHLARQNKSDVDNPALTAISRPSDHDNLWGDEAGETMKDLADSAGGVYQPPYYFGSTTTHEPGGVADHDGTKMPDYNSLCLDCHGNNDVYSNVYGRYLRQIDWGPTGDIHGGSPRYEGDYVSGAELRPPYLDNNGGTSPNYVLACVDCHEPHGTILYNYGGYPSYLYRRAVNGEELGCEGCGWVLNDADYTVMDLCLRCHTVGKHCGSQWECATCHMHGHTAERGCVGGPSGLWNKKVF